MKRVILMIMDSMGVGEEPDAPAYGDARAPPILPPGVLKLTPPPPRGPRSLTRTTAARIMPSLVGSDLCIRDSTY